MTFVERDHSPWTLGRTYITRILDATPLLGPHHDPHERVGDILIRQKQRTELHHRPSLVVLRADAPVVTKPTSLVTTLRLDIHVKDIAPDVVSLLTYWMTPSSLSISASTQARALAALSSVLLPGGGLP